MTAPRFQGDPPTHFLSPLLEDAGVGTEHAWEDSQRERPQQTSVNVVLEEEEAHQLKDGAENGGKMALGLGQRVDQDGHRDEHT